MLFDILCLATNIITHNNKMQQNIKIINTAKTLKGSHLKTHRSHKKIDRLYTEIIQEDDYYFHNIKVQGQCVQISDHHQKQKERTQTKRTQNSQKQKQDSQINQKTKGVWGSKANLFILKGSIKPSAGLIRSITADTALNFEKTQAETRYSRKFTRTQTTMNQDEYPRIVYKQQNLNEQVYCSFKNILDEFNKVKGKSKPSIDDKIKAQDKSFRRTYKKPNFYNYQQFYRQNYQAKHMKQSPFLFKKCQYVPAQQKNTEKQKQNQKQIQRNLTKRTDKVCVCIDSTKMQIKNKYEDSNGSDFMGPSRASRRDKNRTQRTRHGKQIFNKTHDNYMLSSSIQNDKIEPWKVPDHYEIWF